MGIIDYYFGSEDRSEEFGDGDDPTGDNIGQAFRMGGSARDIVSAKFKMIIVIGGGIDTISFAAKIYACSGTPGTDGVPTGAALATSDEIVYTDDLDACWEVFTFSTPYTLEANTNYCLVLECTGWAEEVLSMGVTSLDMSSPTHDGNLCFYKDATPGYNVNEDYNFYAYYAGNWSGKINGISPGKFIGIPVANIGKIIGA